MRIALLGANGQLGRDLRAALASHELWPLARADCDITDHARVRDVISALRPEVVLNAAAYHRVDDCEAFHELAYSVNVLAVLNLVRIANALGALLVHFSTDYVFDGKSVEPYTEASAPMPLSVYGNSKLAGEFLVRSMAERYILIRTCGLYGHAGSRGKGGNFVESMLAKGRAAVPVQVVMDQIVTPTYTADLAQQVAVLLDLGHSGLFHITNEGSCSWFEFARVIFELAGIEVDLKPITTELYKAPAVRPKYSVLENARLKELGLNRMRSWREALTAYIAEKQSLAR
jgi:dTDP-4-dehydrorhamnose reductase